MNHLAQTLKDCRSMQTHTNLLNERLHPTHTAPLYIAFDPRNKSQVEEVKTLYQRMKREGRRMVGMNAMTVTRFQDVVDHGALEVLASNHDDVNAVGLRILDATGDRRIVWRADDPDQVKEAAALYAEYIAKGWKAYAIHRLDPNVRGLRIQGFSPNLEEVIFDDTTTEEKMKDFSKGFRTVGKTIQQKLDKFAEAFSEIKMLPKTYPG